MHVVSAALTRKVILDVSLTDLSTSMLRANKESYERNIEARYQIRAQICRSVI